MKSKIKLDYGTGSVLHELGSKEIAVNGGKTGPVCLYVEGEGGRLDGGVLFGYCNNPVLLRNLARTIIARLNARKKEMQRHRRSLP